MMFGVKENVVMCCTADTNNSVAQMGKICVCEALTRDRYIQKRCMDYKFLLSYACLEYIKENYQNYCYHHCVHNYNHLSPYLPHYIL